MESTLNKMNKGFSPLKKTVSPLIDKLHVHVDTFPEEEEQNRKIADLGFINFNLCLNAQTKKVHTECDASYTVISVPNRHTDGKRCLRHKNSGKFEMHINADCILVIPMAIGTSFAYSGYLLSHRQQIHHETADMPPFVNIVSYNSKQLLENMLQSFCHYLWS